MGEWQPEGAGWSVGVVKMSDVGGTEIVGGGEEREGPGGVKGTGCTGMRVARTGTVGRRPGQGVAARGGHRGDLHLRSMWPSPPQRRQRTGLRQALT